MAFYSFFVKQQNILFNIYCMIQNILNGLFCINQIKAPSIILALLHYFKKLSQT